MNFRSNDVRLNGDSVKWCFGQTVFGQTVFGQMVFRSNGVLQNLQFLWSPTLQLRQLIFRQLISDIASPALHMAKVTVKRFAINHYVTLLKYKLANTDNGQKFKNETNWPIKQSNYDSATLNWRQMSIALLFFSDTHLQTEIPFQSA
jgi:hypothetical protein